ncbi:cold-inducible RNA-binding protein-like isoform X2 [Iris pallida]|uniref:Cold-inducible RNA-binding protein-like isoform X2 n=1 Tax=Iris pallida TaxID=29817 RepID=A0AAX6HCJ1_IRIPA|nr:cold-inducible RNA-binding protein-like isoform X2 [Iris pallida]KAJ6838790.1 cold-inducible RNA-binding protein-like isoform X2 [Iris pallida]
MRGTGGEGICGNIRKSLMLVVVGNPNPKLPSQLLLSRGIASKLFVGGLSFYTTEDSLSEAFSQFGQVVGAKIVMDRVSDRSKGFGFVTFASKEEADRAVTEMNGKILNGRTVFVDYAKAKPSFSEALPIARPPPEQLHNK